MWSSSPRRWVDGRVQRPSRLGASGRSPSSVAGVERTDWEQWHRGYDDPSSGLSRRLEVVRVRLAESLDRLGPGRRRLLSLCAGEGRDVIPIVARHSRRDDLDVVLVEFNESLAARARASAASSGLRQLEVRTGDAGDTRTFADVVPVDVLLLCGIFGNITFEDIAVVVGSVAAMVHDGGTVMWTRGGFDPDLRPAVRKLFVDAGLDEVSFDGEPERYGVGVNVVTERAVERSLPSRLFTFVR